MHSKSTKKIKPKTVVITPYEPETQKLLQTIHSDNVSQKSTNKTTSHHVREFA